MAKEGKGPPSSIKMANSQTLLNKMEENQRMSDKDWEDMEPEHKYYYTPKKKSMCISKIFCG